MSRKVRNHLDVTTEEKIVNKYMTGNEIAIQEREFKDGISPGTNVTVNRFPSYTEMIAKILLSDMFTAKTLQDIYKNMEEMYPFLRQRGRSWKNSVRHTLSLNECFLKVPREDSGQKCNWTVHPKYLHRFSIGNFKNLRSLSKRDRDTKSRANDKFKTCQSNDTNGAQIDDQNSQIRLCHNQWDYSPVTNGFQYTKCCLPPLQELEGRSLHHLNTAFHERNGLIDLPNNQSFNYGCFSSIKSDFSSNQELLNDHGRIFTDFSKFCIKLLTDELHAYS